MRPSHIPCLLGALLVGLSHLQSLLCNLQVLSQNVLGHHRLATGHRWFATHRPELLHSFSPCYKTARHFASPSVSASATPPSVVAKPIASLEYAPSALHLGVASSFSTTALSAPDDDCFNKVSNKRPALAPSSPPGLVLPAHYPPH